jgi:anti-anti-sigma factor
MSPLSLYVEESPRTLRLRLAGDFDLAGIGAVENALDRLSEDRAFTELEFDLRDLTYMDEAGLRAILRADARGRALGVHVVVIRPRGVINRVFTLNMIDGAAA